jgi:hypothetical protein
MWRRRGRDDEGEDQPLDNAWSARPGEPSESGMELVADSALPAETGPIWAPDSLSVWPVEGGRYGLDAHYHGTTGRRRARHQQGRLAGLNLAATVRPNDHGGSTLRLGPLAHDAAWLALEAFLGRPIAPEPPGPPAARDDPYPRSP